MEEINGVPGVPQAIGPYSQAFIAEPFLFLSGQIAIDPKTGKLIEGDIEQQAVQVLTNISAMLKNFGLTFKNCVKTTIFLTDLNSQFQKVNKVYGELLDGAKPARSTIQVAGLPLGAQVEIEMIVRLG